MASTVAASAKPIATAIARLRMIPSGARVPPASTAWNRARHGCAFSLEESQPPQPRGQTMRPGLPHPHRQSQLLPVGAPLVRAYRHKSGCAGSAFFLPASIAASPVPRRESGSSLASISECIARVVCGEPGNILHLIAEITSSQTNFQQHSSTPYSAQTHPPGTSPSCCFVALRSSTCYG